MSSEQLAQLYEVMHVAKDVWKPVEPVNGGAQGAQFSVSDKPQAEPAGSRDKENDTF